MKKTTPIVASGRLLCALLLMAAAAVAPDALAQDSSTPKAGEPTLNTGASSGKSTITLTPLIIRQGEKLVEHKLISAPLPTEERLKNLVTQKIPIVSILPDKELKKAGYDAKAVVKQAGGSFTQIPVTSNKLGDKKLQKKLFAMLDEALARKGSTYIYCVSADRVGAAIALHAAKSRGLSIEDALALGRKAGMTATEAQVKKILGVQ
jgi:protein tyrosine phosphatase (PTP) superfamily phosphohydrolase (DUF442 family)